MNTSIKCQLRTVLVIAGFTSLHLFAQSPDYSCVGFGAATTGGTGGTEVTVSSLSQLITEAASSGKKIIKIDKTFEASGTIVEISNDKTILGVGDKAFLKGIGFHMKNVKNVIIRNVTMTMIGGGAKDIISGETTGSSTGGNYWIDHCEFYNETPTLPETASKKDKYDGILDFKKQVSNITISWCYIHDHWKCSLIGFSTDKDPYDKKITYHHNWFKDIKSRAPSYRAGTAHIYNNFYDGLTGSDKPTSEGVHSRDAACLYVEGNYFQNYSKSVYWYQADSPTEAFVNESGVPNKYVNSPANTARSCNSFTPPYSVTVDAADAVPVIVKTYAGVGKLDGVATTPSGSSAATLRRFSVNEVTGELVLPYDDEAVIAVHNLNGRLICLQHSNNKRVVVNMATMHSGMYIVSVTCRNQTVQQSFLKR